MTDLILDVSRMTVDEQGVQGFLWPVARSEVVAMRDAMVPLLIAAARGPAGSDGEDAELLSIVLGVLVNEALTFFQCHALKRRLAATGHVPVMPRRSRILPALLAGTAPGPPSLNRLVFDHPPRGRTFGRATLNRMRMFVEWNGLSPNVLFPANPKREIFTLQAPAIVRMHACATPETVRQVYEGTWLEPLDDRWRRDASPLAASTAVISAAIDAIRVGFTAGNEELPDNIADFLRGWLNQTTGLVRHRMELILRRPERLPMRLWTGSGGPMRHRILRHATRRVGGAVTGHDHGVGYGFLVQLLPMIVEFESCDAFVTYRETSADALNGWVRPDMLIMTQMPKITALPGYRRPVPSRNQRPTRPRSAGVRTVMLPSAYYNGENVRMNTHIPDIVMLDWEARLSGLLSGWGYQVMHKPHPNSVALPQAGFVQAFSGRLMTERYEDVEHEADAFIFTTPHSNTFALAAAGDRPMVFVDFGLDAWVPEARVMFEGRCRVVHGWFDESNRAQIDWDELRGALEESPKLTADTSFAKNYLPYTPSG